MPLSRPRLVLAILAAIPALVLAGCFGGDDEGNGPAAAPPDAETREAAIEAIIAECQPSSLSKEEQREELEWFAEAAKPFAGMEIDVVAEKFDVHVYESETLAPLFSKLTGIKLTHHIIPEPEVVQKLQRQAETGQNTYDLYVNDTDSIGMHYRGNHCIPLEDFMAGEGKDVTSPNLHLDDFIGLEYGKAGGKLYQLPDQQFANFYWFRHDWFQREDLKKAFEEEYGYPLGVPVNWSAYEDIAEFFTGCEIDGKKTYGHCDYGKKHESLGWRFTDAWLAIAGVGDEGLPNGEPVDEWGIRAEDDVPVGASVSRGGETNGPAAVYGLRKFIEFFEYAPPECKSQDFFQTGTRVGEGDVAQQVFWYNCFLGPLTDASQNPAMLDEDGHPKWRVAPNPHGAYWKEGMKLSYQDCGAWTMMNSTPLKKRKAAWLYAQFCTSKTVSLKKFVVGITPIRRSDLFSDHLSENAWKYGGLIEAYRSKEVNLKHTPTGTNVPHYPILWDLWWTPLGEAVAGDLSPPQALDKLAAAMDGKMAAMEEVMEHPKAPELNDPVDPQVWLDKPGAPKPKLENEKPPGKTVPYEQLLQRWKDDPIQ